MPSKGESVNPLYNEKGIPTDKCIGMASEMESFMLPLFNKYLNEGYSARDLIYVMFDVSKRIEAQHLLADLNLENLKFGG